MFRNFGLILFLALSVGCSAVPSVQPDQSLEEYFTEINFSGSVLIVNDGNVIHNNGYGYADYGRGVPNYTNTKFLIGSITKQFTALAIMQLQEKGMLDIDDYILKYLPNFPNASKIKVRDLLMHSSGLYNFTDEWEEIKYSKLSHDELIDIFRNRPLTFEPGSKVRYSNSGYILAGKIIEIVSGQPYPVYIRENIFNPLGMTNSGYGLNYSSVSNAATGYKDGRPLDLSIFTDTFSAGALSASVDDLYLWGVSFDNNLLVNKYSLAEIFPKDRSAMGMGFGSGRFKVVVGLGWFFYETDYGNEYSHVGHIEGFSSAIARYPEHNSLIIILSNTDQYDVWALKNRIVEWMLGKNT